MRGAGVVSGEVGSLVEARFAVDLGEDAVEDHDVEVEVGVEGGAEAVEEGDGADLGVRSGTMAAVAQAGADGPEQDPELVAEMKSRGPQKNVSTFAFTAAPKEKTLELSLPSGLPGRAVPKVVRESRRL